MMVKVDRDVCIGAGHCETRCPDIFKVVDGKSQVLVDLVPKGLRTCVQEAMNACPVGAISIS